MSPQPRATPRFLVEHDVFNWDPRGLTSTTLISIITYLAVVMGSVSLAMRFFERGDAVVSCLSLAVPAWLSLGPLRNVYQPEPCCPTPRPPGSGG